MKNIIYFFLVLFLISYQAFATDSEPAPGRIEIEVPDGFFNFPLEVYGANISYEKNEIKLDSALYLTFKPNSRNVKEEKKLSIQTLQEMKPKIMEELRFCFPTDFVCLLKKFKVNKIERIVKTHSPEDTIPHPIRRRDGKEVYVKSTNYNKYLLIHFDKIFDPRIVAEEFKKLPYIPFAQPEYPIKTFESPDDEAYQYGYQYYLHDYMMNFQGAWDYIKGENGYVPITIAVIDGDFTNCNHHPDLSGNLNTNGPGVYSAGGTPGHGTSVASVACAVTNNTILIAGGTWNCQFMPYAAHYPSQVVTALTNIRDNLNNPYPEDNCYVVNMSIGTTNTPSLENICNDLYNNEYVLLVAAVGEDGTSQVVYPASYSSVIGVGASNASDDGLYSSSNWGDDVELVATGESVQVLNYNDFYVYEPDWGTSFAAPFVSSLCALILSTEEGFLMYPDQIRSRMQSTADYIYDFNHHKSFWRINAGNAVFNVITGIEDEIWVYGPTLLYQNQNYEFTGEFYDYSPYGNYIVGPWSWSLEGKLTNGIETLASGQTYGSFTTSWNCTVPAIDIYQNWIRDRNSHIFAYVHASAQDNDGYWHSDDHVVSIDVQPFAPQNLTASLQPGPGYQYFFPRLNWTPNSEPDMKDYLIYRMVVNNGQVFERWHQIAITTYSSFTDETMPVLPAGTYDLYYKIRARDDANQLSGYSNHAVIYGVEIFPQKGILTTNVSLVPRKMELLPNFPNPFNPETKIRFGLPEEKRIELSIYSITGQKIVTLLNNQLESGYHTIVWDGKDENGKTVASGLYIYELLAGGKRLSDKMFLMK